MNLVVGYVGEYMCNAVLFSAGAGQSALQRPPQHGSTLVLPTGQKSNFVLSREKKEEITHVRVVRIKPPRELRFMSVEEYILGRNARNICMDQLHAR